MSGPASGLQDTNPFVLAVRAGWLNDTDTDYAISQGVHDAIARGGRATQIATYPELTALWVCTIANGVYADTPTADLLAMMLKPVSANDANADQVQGTPVSVSPDAAQRYTGTISTYLPIIRNGASMDSGSLASILQRGAATPVIVIATVATRVNAAGQYETVVTGGTASVPTVDASGVVRNVVRSYPGPGILNNVFGGDWVFTPDTQVTSSDLARAAGVSAADARATNVFGTVGTTYAGGNVQVSGDDAANLGYASGGSPDVGGMAITGPGPGGGIRPSGVAAATNGGGSSVTATLFSPSTADQNAQWQKYAAIAGVVVAGVVVLAFLKGK